MPHRLRIRLLFSEKLMDFDFNFNRTLGRPTDRLLWVSLSYTPKSKAVEFMWILNAQLTRFWRGGGTEQIYSLSYSFP
jgi:hypothetical protein